MYYSLKFNSLSAVHAVCLHFLLISVWVMNLAYGILLPSFHTSCIAVHLALHRMTWGKFQHWCKGDPTSSDLVHKGSLGLPCCMYHFRGDLSTSANHCLSWVSGKESGSCCNGGCTTSLKVRRVRQHRLWLEKVSVNMLPFTPSHIRNVFVENVTCFPGSIFCRGKLYPSWQKISFQVALCIHWYCTKPGIWTGMIFFRFHLHLLWVGRGCHKPAQPGHTLLHPPGESEETGITGAGSRVSLQAEDVPHPEGRGTSGSRRQHHLGCAREQKQLWDGLGLWDDSPKLACELFSKPCKRVFKPLPWSVPTLQPKLRRSLCKVTSPKLNQANSGITYSHKSRREACINTWALLWAARVPCTSGCPSQLPAALARSPRAGISQCGIALQIFALVLLHE